MPIQSVTNDNNNNREHGNDMSRKTRLLQGLFMKKYIHLKRIFQSKIRKIQMILFEESRTEEKFIEMNQCQCT